MDESIGAYLKRQREVRKVRLEAVAHATKVSLQCLMAIESDNLEALPSAVFVKGFIRSYAMAIGLNPEEVSLQFEAHLKTLKEGGVVAHPPRVWQQLREAKALPPWVYFVLLGVVIVAAVFLSKR